MAIYQHILVATDFSEQSVNALLKAKALTELSNAKLELLHVVDIPIYPVLEDVAVMGMPGVWDEEFSKTMIEASEKRLDKMATDYGVTHSLVIAGNPSDEINRLAKVNHVDLIVMGFHGLSGLKKLIGSTTHSVINDAPCDVLAVKLDES